MRRPKACACLLAERRILQGIGGPSHAYWLGFAVSARSPFPPLPQSRSVEEEPPALSTRRQMPPFFFLLELAALSHHSSRIKLTRRRPLPEQPPGRPLSMSSPSHKVTAMSYPLILSSCTLGCLMYWCWRFYLAVRFRFQSGRLRAWLLEYHEFVCLRINNLIRQFKPCHLYTQCSSEARGLLRTLAKHNIWSPSCIILGCRKPHNIICKYENLPVNDPFFCSVHAPFILLSFVFDLVHYWLQDINTEATNFDYGYFLLLYQINDFLGLLTFAIHFFV